MWIVGYLEAQWPRCDQEEGLGRTLWLDSETKTAGSVWRLPVLRPRCHWGKGVDAALHVQLPEPDRTAFQFSWPWRKQIMNDRKQLLLTWQAEMHPHGAMWSSQEY